MLKSRRIWPLPVFVLFAACPTPEPMPEPFPPPPEPQLVAETTAPTAWSREAVEDQPRMRELRVRTPAELGFDPGTTAWRPSQREIPPQLRAPAADAATPRTPGAALQLLASEWTLAEQLGTDAWELTTRIWYADEGSAVGVILSWGFQDDSVAGQDYRVQLRREGDSWFVERVEERVHCWRGVTPEGLCV